MAPDKNRAAGIDGLCHIEIEGDAFVETTGRLHRADGKLCTLRETAAHVYLKMPGIRTQS